MIKRRRYNHRLTFRRQMAAQRNELGAQVVVDGISAVVARGFANAALRSPYPDYTGWQAADDIAKKKSEEFWASLLGLWINVVVSK
jgi:hypothetical protein